jgi:hypothetical protein
MQSSGKLNLLRRHLPSLDKVPWGYGLCSLNEHCPVVASGGGSGLTKSAQHWQTKAGPWIRPLLLSVLKAMHYKCLGAPEIHKRWYPSGEYVA